MFEVNNKANRNKFLVQFLPWRDEFNPLKTHLWMFLGFCVFFTVSIITLAIRAALVCYFTGAHSVPLWPW